MFKLKVYLASSAGWAGEAAGCEGCGGAEELVCAMAANGRAKTKDNRKMQLRIGHCKCVNGN